jgi:hypothetical protein
MSHGAVRIVFGHIEEFFFRLFVPEGVQQGDSALERLLDRTRARDREVHCAKLRFGEIFVVMMIFVVIVVGHCECGNADEQRQGDALQDESFHKNPGGRIVKEF